MRNVLGECRSVRYTDQGEELQAVVVNFVRYAIIYMLNTYFHIYVKETE